MKADEGRIRLLLRTLQTASGVAIGRVVAACRCRALFPSHRIAITVFLTNDGDNVCEFDIISGKRRSGIGKIGDTDMKVARSRGEIVPRDFAAAVKDIKLAILQSRARAAHASNVEALKLYFYVGGYVSKKTRTAKWGSGAIDALSNRLQVELPGLRGFSATSIKYMRILFDEWIPHLSIRQSSIDESRHLPSGESPARPIRQMPSDENNDLACTDELGETALIQIRQTASDEIDADMAQAFLSIGFSHHTKILLSVKDYDERWFYIRACSANHWSYTELMSHLRANDYHHVGVLPNNFSKLLPMAQATRAVRSFRDEYLLELVNLDNVDAIHDQDVDERVLSKSLVANIEKTIQALGGDDFCFMGREKRLVYSGEEFFIDLLFYHRGLRAMVAVELKMGKFRPSYLGQPEFYLSALDDLMKKPEENPSIGLLLCEKMNKGFVEFAVRDKSKPLGIATYRTLSSIPKPYKVLAPVIEGVKRVMADNAKGGRK